MAIDLKALKAASAGDPESKVAVKRKWLAEVHKELNALRPPRTKHELDDSIAGIAEKLYGAGRWR